MEPVGAIVLYFRAVWSVRADPTCTYRDAEEALVCPEFDMGHYADVVIGVTLCTLLLSFSSYVLLPIFCCMLITLVWLYFWDKYRVLRLSRKTPFSSNHLEVVAEDLFCVPFGFLAMVVVWRAFEVNYINLDAKYVPWLCFCAFVFHIIIQLFVQHVVTASAAQKLKKELSTRTFEEVATRTACSWFNANPIHCLRSKYIHCRDPPCVPYLLGKEHLLMRNVEAGAFFDGDQCSKACKCLEEEEEAFTLKDVSYTLVEN